MPIKYSKNKARFIDTITVEEAEGLLEWLQTRRSVAKLDLSACVHMHTANVQVLMAAEANIVNWPTDASLAEWLKTSLNKGN